MIKFLVLLPILVLVFIFMLGYMVYRSVQSSVVGATNVKYEIRYNPVNNKFYIVRIQNAREYRFKQYVFFTKYYQSRNTAEIVLQKLKGNF